MQDWQKIEHDNLVKTYKNKKETSEPCGSRFAVPKDLQLATCARGNPWPCAGEKPPLEAWSKPAAQCEGEENHLLSNTSDVTSKEKGDTC